MKSCWYPDRQTQAKADVPCNADNSLGPCCGPNAICLSNGLCLSLRQPYTLSRASCTDPYYGSSCPQECKDAQPSAGSAIVYLNGTNGDDTLYCCNSVVADRGHTVCSAFPNGTVQSPFQVKDGTLIYGVAALANVTTSNSTTYPSNQTSSSTEMGTGPSVCGSSSKVTSVGVGVGVSLGVVALASTVWAFWERRKQRRLMTRANVEPIYLDHHPSAPKLASELHAPPPGPAELH